MSRINSCFENLQTQGRKALIPYIVAGDPSSDFTVSMMHALVKQGADIIELGVPFSDPMAEGPVIQLAHERALVNGISLKDVLAMVKTFRQDDQQTPIVLMGYANPVEHMGYENFASLAADAGVDGLLTVDMPPEEADELNAVLKRFNMNSIFLIAPTTTEARINSIAAMASGYLYYVSLKGVTGAGNLDIDSVQEKMQQAKSIVSLPITVGFGIKDAASAAAIARLADGVVVGSALVNKTLETGDESAAQLIGEMRQAIDAIAN